MDRCSSCGASLAAAAAWCGQCFTAVPGHGNVTGPAQGGIAGGIPAPAQSRFAVPAQQVAVSAPAGLASTAGAVAYQPDPRFAGSGVPTTPVPGPTLADLSPPRKTRWRKTHTTFGPVGRVVCTVLLVVPLPIMIFGGITADPFALGGAGLWGLVIMPWGLRDVWKAGQLPAS